MLAWDRLPCELLDRVVPYTAYASHGKQCKFFYTLCSWCHKNREIIYFSHLPVYYCDLKCFWRSIYDNRCHDENFQNRIFMQTGCHKWLMMTNYAADGLNYTLSRKTFFTEISWLMSVANRILCFVHCFYGWGQ